MNNPTTPSLISIPTHPLDDFDLLVDDNPTSLSGFSGSGAGAISSAYPGFTPVFAHQIVNDKYGNVLFYIVDNYIYNKNGYGFDIYPGDPGSFQYVLKDADNLGPFNTYATSKHLHNNIIVVPVPNTCNQFYIIYAIITDPLVATNTVPRLYYKKITILRDTEIEMTDEIEVVTNLSFACSNCSSFSMDITTYNEENGDYLLVVQWMNLLNIYKLNENFNTTAIQFDCSLSKVNSGCFGSKRPDAVIMNQNDEVIYIHSSSYGDAIIAHNCIDYYRFPRDFDNINSNTINFGYMPTQDSICGMECSPNKQSLYVTFFGLEGIHYYNINNYVYNNGVFPSSCTALYPTGDYKTTNLEKFADNKIYAISHNENTHSGTYSSINNPNSPTTTTFSYNCFNNLTVKKSRILSVFDEGMDRYIFNHQIDNSDYETGYPISASEQPDWNTVPSTVTWSPGAANNPFGSESGIVYFDEDFVIPSGKYVQLSNMEFHFANSKKAVINIGSTLRLVGTKLTSETTCTPTAMWAGVYLEGNSRANQDATNQGRFRMEAGSEVSNAITGVTVEGGAVCLIYGGEFKNNKTGIDFHSYTHPSVPTYNACLVQNADFTIDASLNNGNTPLDMINLSSVKGVNIKSSNFTNSRGSDIAASSRGYAIKSSASNFKVEHCEIEGWYYGCHAFLGTPRIIDNEFTGNFKSLYSISGVSVEITENDFDGDYDFASGTTTPYSVHVVGNGVNNTLYKFEENTIQNGVVGVQFNNLGPNAVKVKDNTFINIDGYTQSCGAVAIGKNSNFISGSGTSFGQEGLEFRCNNFDDNPYALSVIDGNIRKYQGEQGASLGSDYAGNAFDHYGTNLERDFYVKIPINSYWEIPQYQYYSHSDNAHKIMYYTVSRISNYTWTSPFQTTHCEDGGGGGIIIKGMSVGEGSDLIEDTDTEIMLKEYELTEATDNGQTYLLISEVETMNNQNSTEVAQTIAELDGYISDELAISLMQNEEANQFAKAGALLENSPLPVAVKEELDNMDLNPTIKQIIKDNQNGTNPRNAKEAEIAELKQYRSLVISEMYNSAINNDSVPTEKQNLETFLKNDNHLQSKIYLYNFYKQNRNFEAANATLNTIKLSLENEDLDYRSEMENYLELEKILLDIEFGQADLNEAVENNFDLIDFIANNESYAGQVSAQLLLQEAGLAEYSEIIKLPEPAVTPKNAVINNKPAQAVKYDDIINVYPNPASEVFYVEYALLGQDSNATLQILNLNGSIIENIKLKQNAGIFVYNKKLAAGTYIIKVGNNYTQKITIN